MTNQSVILRTPGGGTVHIEVTDTGKADGAGNQLYRLKVDDTVPMKIGVNGEAVVSGNASAAPVPVTDAPESTKHLCVHHLIVSADAAMRMDFTEETSNTLLLRLYANANSAAMPGVDIDLYVPTNGKRLMLQTDKAGNLAVTSHYYEV